MSRGGFVVGIALAALLLVFPPPAGLPLAGWRAAAAAVLEGLLPVVDARLGEDLPPRLYLQWRRWCGMEHYFFDDPEMKGIEKEFERVTTPIVAANSLDDLWALPRSRDAFMQAYRNAEVTRVDIDPQRIGAIGHMGYFRQHAQPLWDDVLDWFTSSTSDERTL